MINVIRYGSQDATLENWTRKGEINTIINGMNCFGQFVKPEQKVLKSLFPGIIKADRQTQRGDSGKLGTTTVHQSKLNNTTYSVINAYVMFDWGTDKNTVDYEALADCLNSIAETVPEEEPISLLDPGYSLQSTDTSKMNAIIEATLGSKRSIYIFIP